MVQQITLKDIITKPDFLKQINSAADLSFHNDRESGFLVHIDESLSQQSINRAVLGNEPSQYLSRESYSINSEMTLEAKHNSGEGSYIPECHYRLVDIHFHPRNSNLRPSASDIEEFILARKCNTNLRDSLNDDVEETDADEKSPISYEVKYANPVSLIGLVKNDPRNIGLLAYQQTTKKPIDFESFCRYVARHCYKKQGKSYNPILFMIPPIGFPIKLKSTKDILGFLNESGSLKSISVRIRNGKLSEEDLRKLAKFQLIDTQVFQEDFPKETEEQAYVLLNEKRNYIN